MKRIIFIITSIVLILSMTACGSSAPTPSKGSLTYSIGTTEPQSTIHAFQDLKYPDSWQDDGQGNLSGTEWPDNKLSNIIFKPEFGDNISYSAGFLSNYASFAINVDNATLDEAKHYYLLLLDKGFKMDDNVVDKTDIYYFQGHISEMLLYLEFNKTTNHFKVIISKAY